MIDIRTPMIDVRTRCLGWIVLALVGLGPSSLASDAFQKEVLPFLATNCFRCHGNGELKADLSLDKFKDELAMQQDRKTWDKVVNMLQLHEMPPKGEPQPTADETDRVLKSIDSLLANFDCGKPGKEPIAGRVTIRRLNRTEYNNTIRDLMGINFRPADDFPSDDVGYGFDNIGDVLNFSPLLAEKYLIAAETILEEAIVIMDPPKRTSSGVGQLRPASATAIVEQGGYMAFEAGDYTIRAKVGADQCGEETAKAKMRLTFQATNEVIESEVFEIPGTKNDPTVIQMNARLKKGSYRVGVLFLNPFDFVPENISSEEVKAEIVSLIKTKREQEAIANTRSNFNDRNERRRERDREARQVALEAAEKAAAALIGHSVVTRTLYVKSIDTEGPDDPPPPDRPETHNRLMAHSDGLEPREAAKEIIIRFASKAFRRPVRPIEVEHCLSLYDKTAQQHHCFELCIRAALLRVLVSPYFLFRTELDPSDVKPGANYAVSEYDLASRLSYFLWNSMPDDELIELAANGNLRSRLGEQVKRMLRDPKSSSFIDNFAEQWLALRKLDIASPDPSLFPEFTPELRQAMVRESLMFFGEIARENRSILDLLTADFTFVNEPLAKLYGIADVNGNEFVRVAAPLHRGGILTQASVLTLTSNATRTSPVKRGKFVLEQILNTPPPPADVPPLEEDKILTGSVRQVMEQHRENAMCASCHAKMDPLGFALENFNAIGAWRDKDGEFDVDASGVLPGGRMFTGPDELKLILRDQKQQFVRCIVEKMLTYAIGRGLEYYDQCAVDEIQQALAADDYKFSTLLIEIVKSDPFQMRMAASSTLPGESK